MTGKPDSGGRHCFSTLWPNDRLMRCVAPPWRAPSVGPCGANQAEGIETGHPTMPVFQLEPDQINDLLSYLKTLE
jgi:hypothetical protein